MKKLSLLSFPIALLFLCTVAFAGNSLLTNKVEMLEKAPYAGPISTPDPNVILQGGDTWETATVISAIPYSNSGTTAGYTNDYDPGIVAGCPYSGSTAPDVVYSFIPAADISVDITLCAATDYDSKLYVCENDISTVIACSDDYCTSIVSYVSAVFEVTMIVGNTYYIVVDGYAANFGNYSIDITENVPIVVTCPEPNTPEGEPDCYAEYVDVTNGGCNSDPDVFGVITDGETICGTGGDYTFTGLNYRDTDWYTLTLADRKIVTITGQSEFAGSVYFVSHGPVGFECDSAFVPYSATITPGVDFTLTATLDADYYWVWVGSTGDQTNACGSVYYITCTQETPPEAPANDLCSNAQAIGNVTDLPYSTAFATAGEGDGYMTGPNIWYDYTCPADGNVQADLCGSTYDSKITVYEGSCGSLTTVVQDDDACGSLTSLVNFAGVAGNHYLIEVGGFSTAAGDGDLTVSLNAPVFSIDPSIAAGEATEGNSTSVLMTVSNNGIGNLEFTLGVAQAPFMAPRSTSNVDDRSPIANANPNIQNVDMATKLALAEAFEAEMEAAKLNKSEGVAVPVNPHMILQGGDNFGDATVIASLPYNDAGTTVGYANDVEGNCGGTGAPDVFYSYTPGAEELVTVSLCGGTPYDSKIMVYQDDVNTLMGCNDDYCGAASQIDNLTFTTGHTYFIVVDGYAANSGTYTLDVTVYVPPTCTPDVFVSIPAEMPYTNVNTTCGMVNDFNNTCLGSYDGGEDIIYEVTVTSDINVDLWLDPGVDGWTGIAIDDACPPDGSCLGFHTASSGAHGISGVALTAGTYYIMIDTWPSPDCIASYTLTINEAAPPPANDECLSAEAVVGPYPVTTYGTNLGATIDCPGVLNWNAVWYAIDLPYANNTFSIDYCPTDGSISTVGIVYYNDCFDCSAYQIGAYQWVTCGSGFTNPQITWENIAGPTTVYFPVYVVGVQDFAFTTNVTEFIPCDVTCPVPNTPEGEEDCYTDYDDITNSGCNAVVEPVFGSITPGETICGTTGVYSYIGSTYRDTDWYLVNLTGPTLLTLTGTGEPGMLMGFIVANSEDICGGGYVFNNYFISEPCSVGTVSYAADGTVPVIVFASTDAWDLNYVCGSEYWVSLEGTPLWLSTDVTSGSIPEGGSMPINVGMSAASLTEGTYNGTLTFNTNELVSTVHEVPATFVVGVGGACNYVVGDVNNNGAFNGIDVTYGVGYFKGGPVPPYACECNGSTWYVAGDVNGSCVFNGIDITYMVSYFKGGPGPIPCPACAP